MAGVIGKAFRITQKDVKSYGYANPRSSGSASRGMRRNGGGVTAIAAINGRGAYQSARQAMNGLPRGARIQRARELTRAGRAKFARRMREAQQPNGARMTHASRIAAARSRIRRAIHRTNRHRANTWPGESRRHGTAARLGHRRRKAARAASPVRRKRRKHAANRSRTTVRRRRHAANRKRTTVRRRRHAANPKRRSVRRRRHAANPKRRSVRRRRHAANPKRRVSRRRKHAANPRRRRVSRRRHASNRKRRVSRRRKHAANPRRRRVSRKRHASNRKRRSSRRRHASNRKRRVSRKRHASNRKRRSSPRRRHTANRRRRHASNRRRFSANQLVANLKAALMNGAIATAGFMAHKVVTKVFCDQVCDRLFGSAAKATPPATSGLEMLQPYRAVIGGAVTGAIGIGVTHAVVKDARTKMFLTAGIATSFLQTLAVTLLNKFAPAQAAYLAGADDGTAARLSAMYGLGAGASIMPQYAPIGEYFQGTSGLGEFFTQGMQGLGYTGNPDLYQAAAGVGAMDAQSNHIDPSSNLDRELTIAEAAAGVGSVYQAAAGMGALKPFEASAGTGEYFAQNGVGEFFSQMQGLGNVQSVQAADTWIPGTSAGQLWAGVRSVSDPQSAHEMVSAGILQSGGNQGVFG